MEIAILICLSIVIVIVVVTLAVVLHNLILLLNELNKRLICIVTDILQTIDLSTPHLDALNPEEQVKIEDLIDTPEGNYFNPHEYNPEDIEEIS